MTRSDVVDVLAADVAFRGLVGAEKKQMDTYLRRRVALIGEARERGEWSNAVRSGGGGRAPIGR